MNKKQIDQLEMLVATETVLDAHVGLWSAVVKIAEAKTGLSQAILAVKDTAKKQESSQVFIGEDLNTLKRKLAGKMDVLDDILESYAEDIDDPELQKQANNSMTDYYRLSHEEFEIKVTVVIGLIDPRVTDLADYGLTPELVEDAKTAFNEFEALRGKPRAYQIASRVATDNLATRLSDAMEEAYRLDRLLKRFRRTQPDFYKSYTEARKR